MADNSDRVNNVCINFAKWIGQKQEADSWFKYNAKADKWYIHTVGHITTKALYRLYLKEANTKE